MLRIQPVINPSLKNQYLCKFPFTKTYLMSVYSTSSKQFHNPIKGKQFHKPIKVILTKSVSLCCKFGKAEAFGKQI